MPTKSEPVTATGFSLPISGVRGSTEPHRALLQTGPAPRPLGDTCAQQRRLPGSCLLCLQRHNEPWFTAGFIGPLGDTQHGMQLGVPGRIWVAAAEIAPSKMRWPLGTCAKQPHRDVNGLVQALLNGCCLFRGNTLSEPRFWDMKGDLLKIMLTGKTSLSPLTSPQAYGSRVPPSGMTLLLCPIPTFRWSQRSQLPNYLL